MRGHLHPNAVGISRHNRPTRGRRTAGALVRATATAMATPASTEAVVPPPTNQVDWATAVRRRSNRASGGIPSARIVLIAICNAMLDANCPAPKGPSATTPSNAPRSRPANLETTAPRGAPSNMNAAPETARRSTASPHTKKVASNLCVRCRSPSKQAASKLARSTRMAARSDHLAKRVRARTSAATLPATIHAARGSLSKSFIELLPARSRRDRHVRRAPLRVQPRRSQPQGRWRYAAGPSWSSRLSSWEVHRSDAAGAAKVPTTCSDGG